MWAPSVALTPFSCIHTARAVRGALLGSCAGPGPALAYGRFPKLSAEAEKVRGPGGGSRVQGRGSFLFLPLCSAIVVRKLCLLSPPGQEENERH